MMGEWVVSVESSASLVVVRTPPGCAHVVASALDRSALEGVLGSVAGDDTILVIASEKRGGEDLAREFRALAGIDEVTSTSMKGNGHG
jgi:transcriptional regulator of arginine metabolism